MKNRKALGALMCASVIGGLVSFGSSPASASSHREAPLISQDPVADNTDLYLYRDPTDPSKVNIVANFIGLEQPAGGPNFAKFGDDVMYEIHLDNNGDVKDDITYQFRFRTIVANPGTFLYNTNTINPATYANQNVQQVYTVRKIVAGGGGLAGGGSTTTIATDVPTPPVNVGPRSTPDYQGYVARSVRALPGGGKVFAGQRNDPFFVDLGSVFDLLGLRPINNAHVAPLPAAPGRDGLAGKNVHSIVMQLPIAEVTSSKTVPTVVDSKASVVGAYASTSRQSTRVLSSSGAAPQNSGSYVQVSRLGIPLVNEVLIPLGSKDKWNASLPANDAQFFGPILDPEPTRLLPVVYPSVFNASNTPKGGAANRPDLIKLLTGQLAGLSPGNALPPADLLRVNLAVPPVQGTVANRMAALAGDPGGFPNGRRLTDDVVDIELQVLAGILLDDNGVINGTNVPYSALADGVNADDGPAQSTTFPFVGNPFAGYDQPATG